MRNARRCLATCYRSTPLPQQLAADKDRERKVWVLGKSGLATGSVAGEPVSRTHKQILGYTWFGSNWPRSLMPHTGRMTNPRKSDSAGACRRIVGLLDSQIYLSILRASRPPRYRHRDPFPRPLSRPTP